MVTHYCNSCNRHCLLFLSLGLWVCYQFLIISEHSEYILTANPRTFAETFNIIEITRTNLHSKTFEYWSNWLNTKTTQQIGNKAFSLLHFDYHSNYDITYDSIQTCSPSQLIYYHQLVEQVLESLQDLIHTTNSPNISQYIYEYGYINQIIWVYPDHWTNYSELFVYGLNYHRFRKIISNMTYYLTPIANSKCKYTFAADNLTTDEIEFFQTKLSFSKTILPQLSDTYNSTESVKFQIHAIPLSELQNINVTNEIILDFDLDFFICQSPSQTLKDYFNWNNDIIDSFNTYLSHHQYYPSHIHSQDLQYTIMVLLHQLSHNQSENKLHQTGLRSDDKFVHELDESIEKYKHKMKHDVPKIADIIEHATEYDLDPLELRDLLYHLYRFHLEIGDMDFVQPINDYINSHHHLDTYLQTIDASDSHVVDHYALHKSIAHKFQLQLNLMDNIVYNMSVNEFGQQIDHIFKHSHYDAMEQWIQNHKSISSEINDLNIIDEEKFISDLLKQMKTDGTIYKLTPQILSDIINNVINEQNYNISMWKNIVNHSQSLENIEIWAPNHTKFIDELKNKYAKQINSNTMTYAESLEQLHVSGDYLYSEWENILNNHISNNNNASWINKYIGNQNSSYNLNDYIFDEDVELSTYNLSTIITWDSLDPIQKHFLRKGNHSLLEQFVSKLTKHQKMFLDWLIFCHLHANVCENGHSPIDLLDTSNEYYYKLKSIEWDDINELPAIISSEKHNDMLQFTTVFHGLENDNINPIDSKYAPSIDNILESINRIQNLLTENKLPIIAIGIEMSYGHIPKKIHEWLDCQLSISLHNTLNNPFQFIRFQTFDGKVLTNECVTELL